MRMSEWLVLVGVMAVPLFACSSSDSGGGSGGYSGGTGGAVMGGTGGGTGGANTGGANTGGANTGGANTGGANTGGANTGGANTGGTGVGGGGTGGSTMQECTAALWRDAACGQCMETNCVGACEACLTNADCAAWAQCVFQCQDMACYDACDQNNPNGAQLGNAWIGANGCFGTACGDACGGGQTPICDSGLAMDDAACATCLGTNCCNETKACAADATCLDCVTGQSTQGCDSNAAYTAANQCFGSKCANECGGGTPICDSGLAMDDAACATCLGNNCCNEIKDCAANATCLDCVTGQSTQGCDSNTQFQAFNGCAGTNCQNDCAGP